MGNTTFTDMQKAIFNYIRCQNSLPEPVLLVFRNGKYICGDLTVEIFRINIDLRWKATLKDLVLVDEGLTTEQRFDLKDAFDDILEEQNEYQRTKFVEEYNVKPGPGIVSDIVIEEPGDNNSGEENNSESNENNNENQNDSGSNTTPTNEENNSGEDNSGSNSGDNSGSNSGNNDSGGGNYFSPRDPIDI